MNHIISTIKTISISDGVFGFICLTLLLLPTGTAPPVISTAVAVVIWLLSDQPRKSTTFIKAKWFAPILFFILLPFIGLLYSKNIELGIDYALKSKYWIVSLITAGAIFKRKFDLMIYSLWAGLAAGSFLAMLQFYGVMSPIREGFLGFGTVHTLSSMYLLIGILMASFYFKISENLWFRVSMVLLILIFIFHLTVLEGRNGYIVFILLSPIIGNNLMHKFSLPVKLSIATLLVLSIGLSPVVQNEIKWTKTQLEETEVIFKGEFHPRFDRPFMFHTAAQLFFEHPLLGTGTGSYRYYTQALGHPSAHPHNSILYMAASFGILGLFVYFWLFTKMFKIGMKNRRNPIGFFTLSICLTIFFGGFLNTPILNTGTLLCLTMGFGFLNHLKN